MPGFVLKRRTRGAWRCLRWQRRRRLSVFCCRKHQRKPGRWWGCHFINHHLACLLVFSGTSLRLVIDRVFYNITSYPSILIPENTVLDYKLFLTLLLIRLIIGKLIFSDEHVTSFIADCFFPPKESRGRIIDWMLETRDLAFKSNVSNIQLWSKVFQTFVPNFPWSCNDIRTCIELDQMSSCKAPSTSGLYCPLLVNKLISSNESLSALEKTTRKAKNMNNSTGHIHWFIK